MHGIWGAQLGKLDLTEIEGIADLLAADTAAQQRQARPVAHQGCLCSITS